MVDDRYAGSIGALLLFLALLPNLGAIFPAILTVPGLDVIAASLGTMPWLSIVFLVLSVWNGIAAASDKFPY